MRIAAIAATLVLAAPLVLSAQKPSPSTSKTRGRVEASAGGTVTATPRSHMNDMSSMRTAAPETVYVKGNVYGEVPTGTNYVITGSKTSFKVDTVYTGGNNMSSNSSNMDMSTSGTMTTEPKSDLEKTADKAGKDVSNATKKAGKDISNEAKRTPKNLDKTARKVGHGAKEAASDVKKAVTGKP